MRTLSRDKKALYICSKIKESNPVQFEEPKKYYLNVVSTNSQADIATFGESYKEYRKVTVSTKYKDLFHEGDRAYIYVTPSDDKLCNDADFVIYSVSDSITETVVLFKRMELGK